MAKPGVLTKWKPKKWQPEYERMVAYSFMGMSNKMIALKMGYTPVHVSNVLNLEEAEALRLQLMARMRENVTVNIPSVLEQVAGETAQRLLSLMKDDTKFETTQSSLAIIDRGMDVLKGLRHLKSDKPSDSSGINATNVIIGGAAADNLIAGLNKANEVRQIHSGTDG